MHSSQATDNTRFFHLMHEVGCPLVAIFCLTSAKGIPVGAFSTIEAAALTGAVVPVLGRFVLAPMFKSFGLADKAGLSLVLRGAVNALVGLAIAVATLPT